MTRALCLVVTLVLAAPALATNGSEEPGTTAQAADEKATPQPADEGAEAPEFSFRRIDFGLSSAETNTASSRFREYRSLPSGIVLPYVRFAGSGKFRYDLEAKNVLQGDASYRASADPWGLALRAGFEKIPHSFGNNARSILNDIGNGNLAISDSLQRGFQAALETQFAADRTKIAFPFLNELVSPTLAAARLFDLRLTRDRGFADVNLTKDKPVELHLTYQHEKRVGNRASGTSFGFSNVVETPEPIDYRTQDLGASAEWTRPWGLVRGALHFNWFSNAIATQRFDNPFRAVDSTDPSAYTAPGSGSIGGASFATLALPPDNKAVTGSLGFVTKFGGNSRLSADASLGQWTQNDSFIAFSTNSAITSPVIASDLNALPARSLDGKIKTFSLSTSLTSRPIDHVFLAARFRRYDLSNDTPRVRFAEGYVRYDAVFEDIPRISVPYGYANDHLTLSAAYDFGSLDAEAGYKLDRWDRTFRETEKTSENTGYAKLDLRASDWIVLRGTFEAGSRDFAGLEIELSEDASFLNPGTPANVFAVEPGSAQLGGGTLCPPGTVCNLRYDQAKRDARRYGAHLELSPGGNSVVTLSFVRGKDDYPETRFGLTEASTKALSVDADYTPSDRLNVYASYTRDELFNFQRGRQSGSTVSNNPADDWTSEVEDKADTFGAGATFGVVRDKSNLRVWGSYQRVNGNNDMTASGPTVRPTGATDITDFDDTKLYTLAGEVDYRFERVVLAVGGWYEYYRLRDANTTGLVNYVPGSFFLAPEDADYKASVLYLRASYVW